MEYIKRAVSVEAMQFTGANVEEFVRFVHDHNAKLHLTYSVPSHGRDQVIGATVMRGDHTVGLKLDMFVVFPDTERVYVVTKSNFAANYEATDKDGAS